MAESRRSLHGTRTVPRLAPPGLFGRVSVGRVSEVIADQIRQLIRQGQLKPGDRLPNERELCESFGVSRITVREGLRILETAGLVEIRVGSRGGAFVTVPTGNQVGDGLSDLFTLSVISAAEVTELRQVIETGIVPLVCARVTDADLDDLDKICVRSREALNASDYSMTLSADFHERVAAATHNPALAMLVESFRGPILMSLREAQHSDPEMVGLGIREHEQFVSAIRDRDVPGATRIMRDHLKRTADRLGH
jgi:GntR family transcriptional repressor for pyruvate dehydrogenase complex